MLGERNYETFFFAQLSVCLADILIIRHLPSRHPQTAVRRQAFILVFGVFIGFSRPEICTENIIVSAGQRLEGLGEEVGERPAGPGAGDLLLGGRHPLPEELLHPSPARRTQCQRPEN